MRTLDATDSYFGLLSAYYSGIIFNPSLHESRITITLEKCDAPWVQRSDTVIAQYVVKRQKRLTFTSPRNTEEYEGIKSCHWRSETKEPISLWIHSAHRATYKTVSGRKVVSEKSYIQEKKMRGIHLRKRNIFGLPLPFASINTYGVQ